MRNSLKRILVVLLAAPLARGSACAGDQLYAQAAAAGCTSIDGDLVIVNVATSSLAPLSTLASISGSLHIVSNAGLTSLAGLEGLTSIGGELQIVDNPALTSLTGLSALTTIGRLRISSNAALTSLTGIESLAAIGGQVQIDDNPALASLTGLSALTTIGGRLRISSNAALSTLAGVSALATVDGDVKVEDNPALARLDGLEGLRSVGGQLYIVDNPALSSFDALSALAIGDGLYVHRNDALPKAQARGPRVCPNPTESLLITSQSSSAAPRAPRSPPRRCCLGSARAPSAARSVSASGAPCTTPALRVSRQTLITTGFARRSASGVRTLEPPRSSMGILAPGTPFV